MATNWWRFQEVIGSDTQILYSIGDRERLDKRQEQAGVLALLVAPHAFARDMAATDSFSSSSVDTSRFNWADFNLTESVPYFTTAGVVAACHPSVSQFPRQTSLARIWGYRNIRVVPRPSREIHTIVVAIKRTERARHSIRSVSFASSKYSRVFTI